MSGAEPQPAHPLAGSAIPERAVPLLLGVIPDAMMVVDRDRRILAANAYAERMFGYEREELNGQPLEVLVPESFRAAHARQTKEYVLHPRPRALGSGLHLEGRRKDGSSFPVDISLGHLHTTRGSLTTAVVRDITASEASYRGLVEGSIQGILVHQDGRVRFANPALVTMLGYHGAGELVGRPVDELVSPDDRAHITALRAAWRQSGSPSLRYETRILPNAGAPRWFECVSSRATWNGAPAYLVTMVDVSDRKHVEDRLRASEGRYRGLVEGSIQGIAIRRGETVVFANRALARMLGWDRPEEIMGRSLEEFVAPEDWPRVAELSQAVLRGDVGSARYEVRQVCRDGSAMWVDAIVSLTEWDGEPALLATLMDITEQRRLEEQYRQAQKMEAVGQLAGGVAHDFNNLLTAVMGYTELVLEELPPQDPRRDDLLEVRRAADRAAALTRQLLAFSRRQVLQPRVLNLNDVVTGMEKMLRRLIGEDVALEARAAPHLPGVLADPGQLEQVIMNLAVNARDAMPSGGKLTIETSVVELDQTYVASYPEARVGRYVLLAISDTGAGMDADTQGHLFEPFFTTKAPGKGTGLGLATVYGIVKQSGGHVAAYSEVGEGTTMKVYLPVVGGAAPGAGPGVAEATPQTGTETVLLVEDEDNVRRLARDILERYGYTVLHARDGAEAVALCRSHRGEIHLMVSDVVMPGMGGPESAGLIRRIRPTMKVLLMSGYPDRAVTEHRIQDPETPFLQKPFTPAALARKVREVLEG
jgi:two-component system cell cycle sensor histidine kinase/response regulator CckA